MAELSVPALDAPKGCQLLFGATTIVLYTLKTFDWRKVARDWQRSGMNSQQYSLGEDVVSLEPWKLLNVHPSRL